MNVLIVEDEKLTAEYLAEMINKYDHTINIVDQLTSVEQTRAWLKKRSETVDLIFMDVRLDDGDAFEIFDNTPIRNPIIFTTAFDEYLIQAFKVNGIDYLLKPIEYKNLSAAIDKFKSLRAFLIKQETLDQSHEFHKLLASVGHEISKKYKDRFMTTIGSKIRIIKTKDIAFFNLEEKIVLLTTFDGSVLPVDYSLETLNRMIDPTHFFRTNRQYIVSLNAIQVIHTYAPGKLKLELHPKAKGDVFVSGDRIVEFKAWLGK